MNSKILIAHSEEVDIFANLAKEEYLLDSQNNFTAILFLWQSSTSIVIGKHQNPWKEALVNDLKKANIPIARRISGGGTVFHDLGNLNYTFITDRKIYNSDEVYQIIFHAINDFELRGEIEEKSNLCVNGKKFSGNAFTFRKNKAMHHGTLLVNADLNSMRKYLKPQFKNIETKAVSSRPASVINLNELNNQITTETLSTSIEKSFIKLFGNSKDITLWNDSNFDNAIVAKIAKKLKSKEWIFDKTPKWRINK
jgi:lipoate---protein ligase